MLKSNFPLFPELNKLRNLGCCLDVSLIGHDGNVSIHLPVLVAANPWVGDIIDHRDSVHVIMMPDYSVMELESCVEKLYYCLQDPDPLPTPYFSVPSTPTEKIEDRLNLLIELKIELEDGELKTEVDDCVRTEAVLCGC